LNNIDKDKLDENSEFLIGSITKIFTAISLLILHQEKKININHTFKKYLDHTELENVKIIDVMNHKAGIKRDYDSRYMINNISGIKKNSDNLDPKGSNERYNNTIEFYNSFKKEEFIKHEKGKYLYSNLGYIILGVLIETITNITYKEFVYKNILKPLKMNHSGFDISKINTVPYTFNIKKLTKYQKNQRFNLDANGGLYSSVSDLIKFKNFHKLLNNNSKKLLQKIYIFYDNKEDKTYIIHHGGLASGTRSRLIIKYDTKWKFKEINIQFDTNL
jgi:CubicO group peptidase (beta-lactamase class C family)